MCVCVCVCVLIYAYVCIYVYVSPLHIEEDHIVGSVLELNKSKILKNEIIEQ